MSDNAPETQNDDTSSSTSANPQSSSDTLGASTPSDSGNLEKDPSDWVSGDDPMTEAQRSYLDTLARQAGEELPADLNKAEASENIDRLRSETNK
jgi:hypothetical protein